MWVISNKRVKRFSELSQKEHCGYSYYSDNIVPPKTESSLIHLGNPYQHTRLSSGQLSHQSGLNTDYKIGNDVIDTFDGIFTLLRLDDNSFSLFSDRFGIAKFFYWINGDEFIISDNLKIIVQTIKAKPSSENMAIYALTYHFIGGRTLYENVYYNRPAEIIEFKDGKLSFSIYWDAANLLNQEKRKVSIREISHKIICAVDKNISKEPQKRISLSLTGGADTRNLLSVFLKLGIRPHLYTYGNPLSADCVKARAIAKGLGLEHEIYDIRMTASIFAEYARKIIRLGNSLASIHRVHRLIAVEHENKYAEVMFMGTLGGEFVKGVSEDDYIVPAIIYENWQMKNFSNILISGYCQRKGLQTENINIDDVKLYLSDQPFFKGDIISRKNYSLSHLTASLHDAQDINLYRSVMDEVYSPFLDVDYLETLFSSSFSFDNKERIKNHIIKRIENPIYASNFLAHVYPQLLQFEYSGHHKPSEVLVNKYYAALLKYIRAHIRPAYPPNFPLMNWMEEFVREYLPKCYDFTILQKTFDLDSMIYELDHSQHQPKESYWLRFTNPIMMMYILEEFGQ